MINKLATVSRCKPISPPWDNHLLIVSGQWSRDDVKQIASTNVNIGKTISFLGSPYNININPNINSYAHWQQTHWSLFAQDEWKVTPDWTWTLGARQYWVESLSYGSTSNGIITRYGFPAMIGVNGSVNTNSAKAGQREHDSTTVTTLRYSGFTNTQLRASYAQGYVYPTLTHKFYDTSAGGSTTYGNPNLKAERSDNYELGARYKNADWLLDGAVYHSRAKDYITTLNCAGNAACAGSTADQETQHVGWATANLAFIATFGKDDQYQVNWALNNLLYKRYTTAHESIPASGFSTVIGASMAF